MASPLWKGYVRLKKTSRMRLIKQVLRNFNEVSQMKGLENNNDDIAINIKLKGKDKFWFVM
jgi:hypothetical protein